MAFKTFAPGNSLAAADVDTYLMNQANIACTSSTRPASPQAGMVIYETDTDSFRYYTGSAWSTPYAGRSVLAFDSGTVSITPSAANTPTSAAVAFTRPFAAAPVVVPGLNSAVPGTTVTGWSVNGITTTGFTAWVTRINTTPTVLEWFAALTP